MIPLLLTFFALGTLMCGLILLDHLHSDETPKPLRRRRSKSFSALPASEVEHPADLEVESVHTATGFARSQ